MTKNQEVILEKDWQDEIKVLTLKAAETSWPLTAFCCFFFIFVEIQNRGNAEYINPFYIVDFGSCIVVFLAHIFRRKIKYPTVVTTYGTSALVALVSTISAIMTTRDTVFTYFLIVSIITVVRGLLYCQEVSKVAAMAIFNHLLILAATLAFRPESYFSLPNILSTNIIQLFMILFSLSGANIRYKLTKSNFISSHRIKTASAIIQDKNRDITDSINYAKRIQTSLLATEKLLSRHLPEHFIFFQPKDIVSGDFYWAAPLINNSFAVVVADSTGHGVPGAIMSMLNISCLNETLRDNDFLNPAPALDVTRARIMEHMANDGSKDGGKDGMDAVLACFNFEKKQLRFAAANNPLWLIRKGELIEFKPDKMPVGKPMGQLIPFKEQVIDLRDGDLVVMITDGYADQFGGPNGKKFMHQALKELILNYSHLSMQEISNKLKSNFDHWKGTYEQVDDVLIFGVRT
ncbi:MAG: SpoIIE family protein phosphatase [bacterium]|nr:SpoIIE family protein phosphatase [bacterium]